MNSAEPLTVYLGVPQTLYGTVLASDGSTADVSGATAVFFMRPLLSRTPVIDAAPASVIWPVNDIGNNISYTQQSEDVAIEGQYSCWWGYVPLGGELIESPEFSIVITDQGPGYGSKTGVIVDGVSQWLATSVDALSQDPNFGDRRLQQEADIVKRMILGQAVAPDLEYQYDPALVEYLAKRTAVRLITPAIDYWGRQYKQVLSEGPSESATYPDMIATLEVLHQRLCRELPHDWLQLQMLVPNLPQLRVETAPRSSLGDPSTDWCSGPVTGDPSATRPARTGGPYWNSWFLS